MEGLHGSKPRGSSSRPEPGIFTSARNGVGWPILGLSPRLNGALRPVRLGTGSKSDRDNLTRCSRASSDEFVDFRLRPSNGARSDLDRSREFFFTHQPINCGTAEAGSFLDFPAAQQAVIHRGILRVNFPDGAEYSRLCRPSFLGAPRRTGADRVSPKSARCFCRLASASRRRHAQQYRKPIHLQRSIPLVRRHFVLVAGCRASRRIEWPANDPIVVGLRRTALGRARSAPVFPRLGNVGQHVRDPFRERVGKLLPIPQQVFGNQLHRVPRQLGIDGLGNQVAEKIVTSALGQYLAKNAGAGLRWRLPRKA